MTPEISGSIPFEVLVSTAGIIAQIPAAQLRFLTQADPKATHITLVFPLPAQATVLSTAEWLTVTGAAKQLDDGAGDMSNARARVMRAADAGLFRVEGAKGTRRIDPATFALWQQQRARRANEREERAEVEERIKLARGRRRPRGEEDEED